MTSTSFSASLNAVVGDFREEGLSETEAGVTFRHQREIAVSFDELEVAITDGLDCVTSDAKSYVFCDSHNYFFLLGLVVDDRDF